VQDFHQSESSRREKVTLTPFISSESSRREKVTLTPFID